MICVFCNGHEENDLVHEQSWTLTFHWRLRVYEGPVCPSCTYNHLIPQLISRSTKIIDDCVLVLDDNAKLPELALPLTSERTNKHKENK